MIMIGILEEGIFKEDRKYIMIHCSHGKANSMAKICFISFGEELILANIQYFLLEYLDQKPKSNIQK